FFPSGIATPRCSVEIRRLPDHDRRYGWIGLGPGRTEHGLGDDLAGVGPVPIELVMRNRRRFAPGAESLGVPAVPLDLGAGGVIVAIDRDLPLTGSGGCRNWIRMRAVVGVGVAALPVESAIIAPEKCRVVTSRAGRLLARENPENVRGVVNWERVVPIQHAAKGAVARPFQTKGRCDNRTQSWTQDD